MMRLHEQSADREIDAAATRVQVDVCTAATSAAVVEEEESY